MSTLRSSLSTWLRLCVLTLSCCAVPAIVWAQAPVPKANDCIVSWNPVTTDIYNLSNVIQGYKVYVAYNDGGTLQWGLPVDVPPSTTPQTTCKALGLNQTGTYALAVTSYNATFESAFSEIVNVSLTINHLYLEVAGTPNLVLNETGTLITVGFIGETPTSVQLSWDSNPPWVTWPTDTFFTLSPDGHSLTANWCITSTCWSGNGGRHVLSVAGTYATGATITDAVTLNVPDSASSLP